jgi:ATP-dependent protease ClpP protease subunit
MVPRRKCICRLGIYDTMQFIKPRSHNCTGTWQLCGCCVIVCRNKGEKKRSYTFKSHDSTALWEARKVKLSDIEITAREIIYVERRRII